jgi:serine phosphatase RsbU (regulator of sigma subunit)/anti-sigma regulatory factor (Ser/Thr protein kinase)
MPSSTSPPPDRQPPFDAAGGESLVVTVPCHYQAVRDAVLRLRDYLAARGLEPDELAAWEIVAMEAANNGVKHSPAELRHLPLRLEVLCLEHEVELRVSDHGPAFSWPPAAALPPDESEDGRGLFLIQSLADSATCWRGPEGNCIVVRRRRRQPGPPAAVEAGMLHQRLQESESALAGMTEELASSYESLAAVFRYSAELGAATDLSACARRLVEDLMQITEADAVVLRLVPPGSQRLEPFLALPETLSLSLASLDLSAPGVSVEVEAAQSRRDVWLEPPPAGEAPDPLQRLPGLTCGVCHPVFARDQLIGTLSLGRAQTKCAFTAVQINLLHTLVDFLGIQIANARLLHERTQTQITRRELEIAASIQNSLLPLSLPACVPFELAASCLNAREVGGDFYDVVPAGPRGLLLVIADVMGKGVPAALFAAVLRGGIRSMPELFPQPARLLAAVNRTFFDDFARVDMFATAQLVFLDLERERLICANAGHPPLLTLDPATPETRVCRESGFPLGIEPAAAYGETSVRLPSRSLALLYTDGVTEARNPQGKLFGDDVLRTWFALAAPGLAGAPEAKASLLECLASFRGEAPLSDDQTFILVHHQS